MVGLFYFKASLRNLPAISCGDGRERRSELPVLEYCLLDTLWDEVFGGHSVRQPSSHSPPYGSLRCRSMKELSNSAYNWDGQTGQPGRVKLATSSLPKDQNSLKSLGRATWQLTNLALSQLKRLARNYAIWPAFLPDLISTKCFDVIPVILRNVLISLTPHFPGKGHTMKVKAASPEVQNKREKKLNPFYTN